MLIFAIVAMEKEITWSFDSFTKIYILEKDQDVVRVGFNGVIYVSKALRGATLLNLEDHLVQGISIIFYV